MSVQLVLTGHHVKLQLTLGHNNKRNDFAVTRLISVCTVLNEYGDVLGFPGVEVSAPLIC